MKKSFYYIIGAILCFYGLNKYADLIIIGIIVALLTKNINNDNFYYMYFGLIFFEPILEVPFIGGSIFRIYQALFIIRIIIDISKEQYIINIKNVCILSGIIIIVTSFFNQNITEIASVIINCIIIIAVICKKKKNTEFYSELLYSIGIMITFSAIYGFFRGSAINYGNFIRKSTTISDPNYSALFLNLGLFSILGNKKFSKKEKIFTIITTSLSLIFTVSMTGIIGATIFLTLYLYMQNKRRFLKYIIIFLMVGIAFICIPLKRDNALYGIQYRIRSMGSQSADDISSGRIGIAKQYITQFSNLSIKEFLFGGNNTVSGEYMEESVEEIGNVSHNSYIDMLFMIGILGTFCILLTFCYSIYNLLTKYKNGNYIALNYVLLKLIILYFAFTISFFPYRYFIAFYMICIIDKTIKESEEKISENTLDS